MADRTQEAKGEAAISYQMALDLWLESNGRPTLDNADKFLKLVQVCGQALRGTLSNTVKLSDWV